MHCQATRPQMQIFVSLGSFLTSCLLSTIRKHKTNFMGAWWRLSAWQILDRQLMRSHQIPYQDLKIPLQVSQILNTTPHSTTSGLKLLRPQLFTQTMPLPTPLARLLILHHLFDDPVPTGCNLDTASASSRPRHGQVPHATVILPTEARTITPVSVLLSSVSFARTYLSLSKRSRPVMYLALAGSIASKVTTSRSRPLTVMSLYSIGTT